MPSGNSKGENIVVTVITMRRIPIYTYIHTSSLWYSEPSTAHVEKPRVQSNVRTLSARIPSAPAEQGAEFLSCCQTASWVYSHPGEDRL